MRLDVLRLLMAVGPIALVACGDPEGASRKGTATEAVPARAEKLPPGATGNCRAFSREGWLVDFDRRGEVALRASAGSPSSSAITATVKWPEVVRGEPMITTVLAQCDVDRILYYFIDFDESRRGWVDVDYLHWRRPTP